MRWGRRVVVGAAAVMIVAGVGCEPTPIDEGNVPPGRNAARAVEVSAAGDALVHGWGEPVPGEGAGGPESTYLLSAEGEWSEPWLDDPVLDVVDGWFSDMNDAGAILGGVTYRPIPGQPGVAGAGAVWDPVTGLRTLPLYTLWFQPTAIAPADIADDGTVIGNVSVPFIGDTTLHRGLVLDATTLTPRELPPPTPFGAFTRATAVNVHHRVVGVADRSLVVWDPPLYAPAELLPAHMVDGAEQVADVNDAGEIVSVARDRPDETVGGPYRGVYWDAQGNRSWMPDRFIPTAIGDDGTVVGAVWQFDASGTEPFASPRAATWTPGDGEADLLPVLDPERPESVALAISTGDIVGTHALAGTFERWMIDQGSHHEQKRESVVRWSRAT